MTTVLFACVHNAGRSQIAAAFFNAMADARVARAISAGTHPATHVHPAVVDVMREVGIDVGSARPQRLTGELAAQAQVLVTMGCGEECPIVPGVRRIEWEFADPKDLEATHVREIRDAIGEQVSRLVSQEGWGRSAER